MMNAILFISQYFELGIYLMLSTIMLQIYKHFFKYIDFKEKSCFCRLSFLSLQSKTLNKFNPTTFMVVTLLNKQGVLTKSKEIWQLV
jgi:hypothetical protein